MTTTLPISRIPQNLRKDFEIPAYLPEDQIITFIINYSEPEVIPDPEVEAEKARGIDKMKSFDSVEDFIADLNS